MILIVVLRRAAPLGVEIDVVVELTSRRTTNEEIHQRREQEAQRRRTDPPRVRGATREEVIAPASHKSGQ